MCKNLARLGGCLALLILLSGVQAFGQAGLGVAVGGALASGSSLIVGQTNLPTFVLFTNGNAQSPQLAESVTAISINPSCKQAPSAGVACNPGFGDLGVFSIVGLTGTGAATSSCAGTVFTFGAPDGNGTMTITPPFILPGGSASTCRINFNINVLTLPTFDCNSPPVGGLQTCSGVTATATDTTQSVAFGTGEGQPTFPISCAAQIDKQVVCDGSTNWQDLDFNNSSGAQGCIGTAGSTGIRVRYRINNPASTTTNVLPITSCTTTESNAKFGNPAGAVLPINPGSTSAFFGVTTAPGLECTNARSGGEPNTATLNCTCASPIGTQTAPQVTDQAQFECCGIAVDKQVSCGGGPFTDTGFNDGVTGSCTTQVNAAAAVRFLATNRGSLPVSCTLTDVPTGGATDLISIPAGTFGTIAAATTLGPVSATINTPTPNTCTAALSQQEPDTGVLNCSFTPPAGLVTQSAACIAGTGGTLTLRDQDSAQIICQSTPLLVTKECIPSTTTPGTFQSSVRISRGNDLVAQQTSCTITDTLFSSTTAAVSCATPQLGTASTVTVAPNPLLTSTNSASFATGTIAGLQFSACNTATVSCTVGGTPIPSSLITYVDPFAPPGTAPTAAKDDCPVGGGCFTRTPGYWGTHPDQAQQVLTAAGGTVFSCGLGLTNAHVPGNLSTTQDICSVGTDRKDFNISVSSATGETSPQQVQLARQCTAAALNLAASANPAARLNCEGALPGINAQFARCCTGPTSVCAAGNTAGTINASNCIGILDAFNNLFDPTPFPSTIINTSAEPGFCQDASGDGFLNFGAGRHYGQ